MVKRVTKKDNRPSTKSKREAQFLRYWRALNPVDIGEPETQYRFHPTRRWAFDFAFVRQAVAVEIQGGTAMRRAGDFGKRRSGGGHNTTKGVQNDCEKSNAAHLMGWVVLKYTSIDLEKRAAQMLQEIQEVVRTFDWVRSQRVGNYSK